MTAQRKILKPLFGGKVFMRLTEYKRPNGGFKKIHDNK